MPTLPDPLRAKVARALWAAALTAGATMVGLLGLVGASGPTPTAVVRNVLLMTALSLATLISGFPALTWFAPLICTTAAMQFGGTSDGGHYWWAAVLDPQCGPIALAVAAALFGSVVLVYAHGLHRA